MHHFQNNKTSDNHSGLCCFVWLVTHSSGGGMAWWVRLNEKWLREVDLEKDCFFCLFVFWNVYVNLGKRFFFCFFLMSEAFGDMLWAPKMCYWPRIATIHHWGYISKINMYLCGRNGFGTPIKKFWPFMIFVYNRGSHTFFNKQKISKEQKARRENRSQLGTSLLG